MAGNKKNRKRLICYFCGKGFYPINGHLKQKSCSVVCGMKIRKNGRNGNHYIKEKRGVDRMCVVCGKKFVAKWEQNGRFGGKLKIPKYCSKDCWKARKGFITPENLLARTTKEYKDWRSDVFRRDGYKCQCCGDKKGGNLQAHHIELFSKNKDKRLDLNNGLTLCKKCHTEHHKNSYEQGEIH